MRLLALVESETHVCCRYRLAAFRRPLAEAGHTVAFQPLPKTLWGKLALGRDTAEWDAVILQRKLLSSWELVRLRRRAARLIFDFDDAVWLRDSHSAKGFDDPRRARRFRATAAACDLVVAGNEYLAEEARRWAEPDRVVVIPTCVDTSRYPTPAPASHHEPSPLRLVWVGSSSTLRGLERFLLTLSAIGQAVPGTRLKLICDRFLNIPDLAVDKCPWSEATEAAEIAAADVGIGWVPDDPWSRGKCGLKVLQYQAAGLPAIANPVGVQSRFVRNEENGFLATTIEEWVSAVRRLRDNPMLRARLGLAGRRQVETEFDLKAGAGLWIEALQRFASTLSKIRRGA